MMRYSGNFFCVFVSLFLVFGCKQYYVKNEIQGFNKEKWLKTHDSCYIYRQATLPLLLENKQHILGLGQNAVLYLLGAADEHELYLRNQKLFHYQLNTTINASDTSVYATFLSVRFNALGYATEVFETYRKMP